MIDPETLKHNLPPLTDKEKKIILIKYIVHGVSPFYDTPLETRIKMLNAAAEICGYDYNDAEWQELGRQVLSFQQEINEKLAASLHKDKDLYKTVMRSLKDGNDMIMTVIDPHLKKGIKEFFGK